MLIRFNFENQENHLKYTMEYSHLIVDEDLGTKVQFRHLKISFHLDSFKSFSGLLISVGFSIYHLLLSQLWSVLAWLLEFLNFYIDTAMNTQLTI